MSLVLGDWVGEYKWTLTLAWPVGIQEYPNSKFCSFPEKLCSLFSPSHGVTRADTPPSTPSNVISDFQRLCFGFQHPTLPAIGLRSIQQYYKRGFMLGNLVF